MEQGELMWKERFVVHCTETNICTTWKSRIKRKRGEGFQKGWNAASLVYGRENIFIASAFSSERNLHVPRNYRTLTRMWRTFQFVIYASVSPKRLPRSSRTATTNAEYIERKNSGENWKSLELRSDRNEILIYTDKYINICYIQIRGVLKMKQKQRGNKFWRYSANQVVGRTNEKQTPRAKWNNKKRRVNDDLTRSKITRTSYAAFVYGNTPGAGENA